MLFVAPIVVIAHDLVAGRLACHEPVVFRAGQAVVQEEHADIGIGRMGVKQVEGEEAQLVLEGDRGVGHSAGIMDIFGAFALDDNDIGCLLGDPLVGEDAGGAQVLDRGDKAQVGVELFVPDTRCALACADT